MINYQFKILIFLGILFVVCGHTGCPILNFNGIFQYDSFHMPLFAFISGYFFHYDGYKNLKKYSYKQIKRLLLPFFLWNIFYNCILTFFRHNSFFMFTMGQDISIYGIVYRSITIGDASMLNIPSWFILTLFLIKMLSYLFRINLEIYKINLSVHKIMLIFLCIGILGIRLAQSDMIFDFKILLSRVLYLSFWYEVGYYYRNFLERYDKYSNKKYLCICLVLQLILLFTHKGESISIIYSAVYPFGALTTILYAANGIAFWLRISKILEPFLKTNKLVLYIGNHTFEIMMHHAFFIKIYNGLLGFLSLNFHIFNDFNLEKYRSEIWYIFLPYGKSLFSSIDVFIGIFFPIAFIYIYEKYYLYKKI